MNKLCLLVSKILHRELLITCDFHRKHLLHGTASPLHSIVIVWFVCVCTYHTIALCGLCTQFIMGGAVHIRSLLCAEFVVLFLLSLFLLTRTVVLFWSSSRCTHCVLSSLLELHDMVLFLSLPVVPFCIDKLTNSGLEGKWNTINPGV